MKYVNFSLIALALLAGCQNEPEESMIDLDQMVLIEEEEEEPWMVDPVSSPQETLIQESLDSSCLLSP